MTDRKFHSEGTIEMQKLIFSSTLPVETAHERRVLTRLNSFFQAATARSGPGRP
jgi:hypothetical protein